VKLSPGAALADSGTGIQITTAALMTLSDMWWGDGGSKGRLETDIVNVKLVARRQT